MVAAKKSQRTDDYWRREWREADRRMTRAREEFRVAKVHLEAIAQKRTFTAREYRKASREELRAYSRMRDAEDGEFNLRRIARAKVATKRTRRNQGSER